MNSKNMYLVATYLALVLLATPLHASFGTLMLYFMLACAIGWTLGMHPHDTTNARGIPLAIIIGIYALIRLIPFMRWGWSALGADMGAYYGNFNGCFASLKACADIPLAFIGYPLHALGLSTQTLLLILHIAAGVSIGIAIYLIAKDRFGKNAAVWSAFVYAISLPQFLFYWSFFLKMEIAIMFSLFTLYAYARNRKYAGIIFAALAGIVHPVTFLPLAGTLIAAGITDGKKRDAFIITAIATAITLIAYARGLSGYAVYIATYINGTYEPVQAGLFSGHFVGFSFYHDALMLFYVPFALIALVWCIAEKRMPIVTWYALINLALVGTNAVFHNRFIVMFDISCIVLAGTALSAFTLQQKTRIGKGALLIVITMLAGYTLYESVRMEPLVNRTEFSELLALQGKYGAMPIFINNALYRQFVAGYTEHPVIITLFSNEPWKKLSAPSLLYNARRGTPFIPKDDARFSRISERVLEYTP